MGMMDPVTIDSFERDADSLPETCVRALIDDWRAMHSQICGLTRIIRRFTAPTECALASQKETGRCVLCGCRILDGETRFRVTNPAGDDFQAHGNVAECRVIAALVAKEPV